jgi:hypothetical protein
MSFDPLGINPVLTLTHASRDIVLAQIKGARGLQRRKLKNVEAALLDVIGVVARQGLTVEEYGAAVADLRREAYEVSRA